MNWLSHLWFGYGWPSDQGNAPEGLQEIIVVGIVTSIFVPRIRRWWIAREQHLHAKLDHNAKVLAHLVHHSPNVPNVHSDGTDLSVAPEHLKGRAP